MRRSHTRHRFVETQNPHVCMGIQGPHWLRIWTSHASTLDTMTRRSLRLVAGHVVVYCHGQRHVHRTRVATYSSAVPNNSAGTSGAAWRLAIQRGRHVFSSVPVRCPFGTHNFRVDGLTKKASVRLPACLPLRTNSAPATPLTYAYNKVLHGGAARFPLP